MKNTPNREDSDRGVVRDAAIPLTCLKGQLAVSIFVGLCLLNLCDEESSKQTNRTVVRRITGELSHDGAEHGVRARVRQRLIGDGADGMAYATETPDDTVSSTLFTPDRSFTSGTKFMTT